MREIEAPRRPDPGVRTTQTQGATPGSRRSHPVMVAVIVAGVVSAALLAFVAIRASDSQGTLIRPSGVPATVSTRLADLMALSPVPTEPAPDFTLTDQAGNTRSLSSFKGQAVVLEFMDPHCVDICPIVSNEFIDAYHDLGGRSSGVVFAAVNVNPYHVGVDDAAAYSRDHQLVTISSWHFFTGPLPSLQAVWQEYGVQVSAPNPDADVLHTSIVYFIDRQGRERFVASPMVDHRAGGSAYLPTDQITSWGRGIALVAGQLVR